MSIVYPATLPPACFTASLIPLIMGSEAAFSLPWSGNSIANLIDLLPPTPLHALSAITAMAASAPTLLSFMHSPPRSQPRREPRSRSPVGSPASLRRRPRPAIGARFRRFRTDGSSGDAMLGRDAEVVRGGSDSGTTAGGAQVA